MKLIKEEKINREITEKFSSDFVSADDGIYLIEIIASAKSWWQNFKSSRSFFKDDDLTLNLDKIEISTSASNKADARVAWNGNELKGFLKTVVIAIKLKKGKHTLSFIPDQKPYLKSIMISQLEETDKITYIPIDNNPAQRGNGRPWLSFILINLSIKDITISAKANKLGRDDDDIKLIIDGETQKNYDKKSHQGWYWCGKTLKGEKKEFKKIVNYNGGMHTIDLWADESPFLEKIELALLGDDKTDGNSVKKYIYKGIYGNEDYNKFDTAIKTATDYWNEEFRNDIFPPEEILDPNLVKAIIFQESRVGYDKNNNGEINVMQVGNYGDASLDVLNGRGKKAEYELKNGRLWKVNYEGKAKVEKPYDSIYWGVRWLYHKAQGATADNKRYWLTWREAVKKYGPPNEKYSNNIWDIYLKGIDKRSKPPLKLWLVILPFIIILLSGAFWLYNNQGRMFFSYYDEKKGHWQCDKSSRLDVALLDGLKLKRIRIDEVNKIKGECSSLMKDSVKYSYIDLDNDGEYEIVLDGKWDNGNIVKYFLKIETDKLAIIPINGLYLYGRSNSLNDEAVNLSWPDERGKYTFATEAIVGYSNAPNTIFRDLYRFNNKGEIELFRRETEELTGNISKIGLITEMPL